MPAVAITDHGTMFGVIDFYNAAQEIGVKPIIGLEAYMAARGMKDRDSKLDRSSYHLLLLAENETGYKNLLKIASASQLEGFYYYPRIDRDFLAAHSEGIICTSGCMSAEIPTALLEDKPEEALKRWNWYYDVFGPDRFYVELQQHNIKEITGLNRKLLELGARYSAKYIATNDVHYVNPDDARLQDILLAIQTNSLLTDKDRMRMTDDSYYLRPPEEMSRLFAEVPESLSNTLLVAERCNVDLSFKGYHLPDFPVPKGYTAKTYLRALCEEGAQRRYGERAGSPDVQERLEYELNVVHKMGFDAYFLIVWDLCRYARENNIWYNARGSAAGSIIAYTLNITIVDPLEHALIFERFLNPGRISMPDIDLDFRDDRRSEMLHYCTEKYGSDKVAQIITFGTMGTKAALRDVGRVMDIPLPEVDRVAKLVPFVPGRQITMKDALEIPDFKKVYNEQPHLRELIDIATKMEGTVRNAGTHAAGVVISDKPIEEYLPLHRPTSNSEETPIKTVTQFEMGILEKLGMLKVDFLGLITLSVMARACDMIEKRHGIHFDLDNIPVDDPKAFELMGSGQTAGVFQVEGCLSGDTYIGHRTIKELYEDFKVREEAGTVSRRELLRTNSCYLDEGRFNPNLIVKAVYSGVKPVYRLSAENYCWIKATADHHFFTQRGWVPLGELNPETDQLLFKSNTSRSAHLCVDCGEPMKSEGRKSQRCKRCSAHLSSNPSRPEVRERISRKTAADTLWIKNLSIYNETQKGVSLETRHGPEKAAEIRAKISARLSGRGNPMYGRPPKENKTYAKDGYREDLGHYVRSSWEADMARVFRYLGWEYHYESRTFELVRTDGSTLTYTPDFFLPEQDTWYEIKGWMDNASAEKIALFQQQYPECKLVVVDKTLFAEFQVKYANLVDWECPEYPQDSEWIRIRDIEFVGEEDTYDLQMLAPGNNFVANGFVVHNSGMTRYLVQMKPKSLDNIIAMVALYRPGPMAFIPDYIARMHGEAEVEYRHPSLAPIFQDTYGIPVYQEQLMRAAVELAGYTPSESDELRKAISKKKKEEIEKHRKKFVKGAIQKGMEKSVAEAIYADWEEFARYGFNKSHAADYGVISVQTAYLKVHYTAEYMAALLSATANETAKVALYVADARSMGIPVLPPEINASYWDFDIEDIEDPSTALRQRFDKLNATAQGDSSPVPTPQVQAGQAEGKAQIRFGLGAIKNVGGGAVQLIVEERNKNGKFKNLNDFARRVDLRAVGKRALECLIKVGAMDTFGDRAALLDSLDRIVAVSSSHFRAADMGQMSLFGGETGVAEDISLEKKSKVERREMLNWERELVGLYISDHPLTEYQQTLVQLVSYFSGQLVEADHEEKVRVAGLITGVRPYTTKQGKSMGFVTLEDIQGNIDLVLFPRIWASYQPVLSVGVIVLVEGKVDAQSTPPKIIVDAIKTEFKMLVPANENQPSSPLGVIGSASLRPRTEEESPRRPATSSTTPGTASNISSAQAKPMPVPPISDAQNRVVMESPVVYANSDVNNLPPPPDNFPDGWDSEWQPSFEDATIAARAEPKVDHVSPSGDFASVTYTPPNKEVHQIIAELEEKAIGSKTTETESAIGAGMDAPPQNGKETSLAVQPIISEPLHFPSLYVPLIKEDKEHPPQQITVLLSSTGDKERNKRRIRTLYGTLTSYHGNDKFSFQIFENGKSYLIDFPNDTTHICVDLTDRLKRLMGEENWRVEEIAFQ